MKNLTERLLLTGDARTAWSTVAPVLATHLGQSTNDHCPWLLSGGTLLAARWGWHRDSSDIDIVVTRDASLSLWPMADTQDRLPQLDAALAHHDWIRDQTRVNASQRSYEHQGTGQALDLFETELLPRMHPTASCVDASTVHTAATAQVLYGKLKGRGHRAPVRDLYDIAVAGETEPRALRCALQYMDANELIRNVAIQLHQTDRYRQQAPKLLSNPTDPAKAADPAPAAAQAIIDHFPAIWRVKRRNEHWTIETFNIHQRRLEHLESTPPPNAPASSSSEIEPGQHAAHLLRRTPPGTSQLYQDDTVRTRLAELEREATKKAATPNQSAS